MSCGWFGSGASPDHFKHSTRFKKRAVKGIGEIVSIDTEAGFVLIDVSQPKLAKEAPQLFVERGVRQATLVLTGETIGSYMAADIISGEVQLNDPVMMKLPEPEPVVEPPVESTTAETAPDAEAGTEAPEQGADTPDATDTEGAAALEPVKPPEEGAAVEERSPPAAIKSTENSAEKSSDVLNPLVSPQKKLAE